MAPAGSRGDGQVADGATAAGLPRPVRRGAIADLAAPHPRVAPSDGPLAGPWLPGRERSDRGPGRRESGAARIRTPRNPESDATGGFVAGAASAGATARRPQGGVSW